MCASSASETRQRRIAVGWERRYHSPTGYWTVGVPPPREASPGGAGEDRRLSQMHIALVHHHVGGKAGGGGGVRLMLELGAGLVRPGHRVTIACHDFVSEQRVRLRAQIDSRSGRSGTASPSCPRATSIWPVISGSTCRRSLGSSHPMLMW